MVSPPPAAVVFGWAVFNAVLVGILPVFAATALETGLYAGGVGIVTGFGAAAALAAARGRTGQQLRQPTRSWSTCLLAAACVLVGLGAVYHWWIAALAVYPLVAALALRAGERLPRDHAPPVPATTRTDPAPVARLGGAPPYTGSSLGTSMPVPADHPAHAGPRPARSTLVPAGGWGLVIALVLRGVVRILARRRRRGDRT